MAHCKAGSRRNPCYPPQLTGLQMEPYPPHMLEGVFGDPVLSDYFKNSREGAATATMDISLIICTRNRSAQLGACLEYVRKITFARPWELILVDNGSVDETDTTIHEFIESVPFPAVYVFESQPGLGNARNAGLKVARGEILAFTDDDCYPAEDFLTRTWAAFSEPLLGYLTGRIMLHDPEDYPATINESISPRSFPGGSLLRTGDIQGANMAFRRRVLVDIGGFDPLFGSGSLLVAAEDLDAAGRASAIGWSGQYCPDVIVRHHHGRKRSDVAPLMRSYAIGLGAYHMKLLLSERRFGWFARSVYEFWRARIWWQPEGPVWEVVGAAKYTYLYFSLTLWRPEGKTTKLTGAAVPGKRYFH
jgi:glycosyltransferase involved in cell wall biosynthesis